VKTARSFALSLTAPLVLFSIAGLTGCSSDDIVTPPRAPVTLSAGDHTLRVDADASTITLLRGETTLLPLSADAIELGAVSALDEAFNYDPYALYVPSALQPEPSGFEWLRGEGLDINEQTDQKLVLSLSFPQQKTATLTLEASAEGRFRATLTPSAEGAPVAYMRIRPRADAQEGFYGLGEHFDDVNQRGKIRAMQIEIDSELESQYNEVHVPIPLLFGTRGWGLFVESAYPGVFAVTTQEDDRVEAAFGTGTASTEGLVFHLFGEEKPLDLTRHYYELTGYPRLPARWALGPWVWRDENKDQAEVENDIHTMRDLDLPATGYWIDRPYATAVNTFDFNPAQFTDAQAMIDDMHALGFRTALWHTPYLDKDDPATAALRDEATSKGYYPPTVGVLLNKWGTPIDLTNPAAYAFWQGNIEKYTSMGVEGFKLDYGEDVVTGITNGRNTWAFADGSDERTMHGRFQLSYHQVYAETLPADGGFLLCRHSTTGDQTNGPIIWPGDLDASFAKHRETVNDGNGSYVAVGGLPAAVVASMSLGPSGFPFFGSDTGGYRHSPPDKELFVRWFEHTALSTVMQIGNSASTVAWEADAQTGFDTEMLDWYRTYTRLHLRLFPYEWTHAQKIAEDGRPIVRPLGLAYPELGQHPNDVYLFGDDLLVAPVTTRGVTERDVPLPAGRWVDWWTGQVYEGGTTIHVSAPLGTLPLFLREGGIIPMLRPTIDTLAPTTMTPDKVDSYATTPGILYARVAPGAAESFTVFDGAEVKAERAQGAVTLGSKDGTEFKNGVVFELVGMGKKPSEVTDGGAKLAEQATLAALETAASGWVFVPEVGGTVFVKVGSGKHAVSVTTP